MQTTEELKREMYSDLSRVSRMIADGCNPKLVFPIFEETLEKYLATLSAERKAITERIGFLESLSNGFAEQAETARSQVSEAISQRDELRNKLQAFEFANKSAGELLRDALATVKRQREYIRTLYISRKARKSKGSTSAQSSAGNGCKAGCGGLAAIPAVHLGSKCAHSRGPDGNCIYCRVELIQIMGVS